MCVGNECYLNCYCWVYVHAKKKIAVCLKPPPPTPEGGKGRGELKSENNIIKKEQTNIQWRERIVRGSSKR